MSLSIIFLLCQTPMFEPDNILKFAEHLYAQEDYAAALQEYRRYMFAADTTYDYVREKIIDCLIQLDRHQEAIKESANIMDVNERNYTKGMIFFLASDLDSSRNYLHKVEIPYETDARRMIGLCYAREFKFHEAETYIGLPAEKPAYKKIAAGALLSLFPGGGHFYAGRYGDGIYSFIIVGTAALLSYYYHDRDEKIKFAFSLGAAVLFYGGNIYGGINAVRNYNYYENERYLEQIIRTQHPGIE
jgi:hypothetical protein